MIEVLLIIHLIICASMVGVVLLQKSEGGALGIGGGGGGGGGFLTGRGTANLLTRTTAGLAAAFFVTSIALSWVGRPDTPQSRFTTPASTQQQAPTGGSDGGPAPAGGSLLDKLKGGQAGQRLPSIPQSQ
ncbi:MAG: preprotein translocase subunit SecG [Pseudomonadota bacterium]